MHEDLTVRENLAYSARLRLSAGKRVEEKAGLVEDAIDLLQVGLGDVAGEKPPLLCLLVCLSTC